jgi:short-subunit dehydrogenase
MSEFLKQKSIIVTGASSGIGREMTLSFLKEGANVLAVGRNYQKIQELTQLSKSLKGRVVPFIADLQLACSSTEAYEKAMSEFGSIDILVNNAGIGYEKEFIDQNIQEIEAVLNTNLISPLKLTWSILPELIKKNDGIIIFVTSLAGKIGFPGLAPYSASKFGIEGFAETLREELKETGIKVCVVRPGVTDTDFFGKAGMQGFYNQVKRSGKIHPATSVSEAVIQNIEKLPNEIIVGSDRIFLKIIRFVPYKWRFKLLDIVNKIN